MAPIRAIPTAMVIASPATETATENSAVLLTLAWRSVIVGDANLLVFGLRDTQGSIRWWIPRAHHYTPALVNEREKPAVFVAYFIELAVYRGNDLV